MCTRLWGEKLTIAVKEAVGAAAKTVVPEKEMLSSSEGGGEKRNTPP